MSPSNKEMQLRKTCELYAYLLVSQDKEVPDEILECAMSYDYPVDCVAQLSQEIQNLDSESFERILKNIESQQSRDLSNWWDMQQEAERLSKELIKTCL